MMVCGVPLVAQSKHYISDLDFPLPPGVCGEQSRGVTAVMRPTQGQIVLSCIPQAASKAFLPGSRLSSSFTGLRSLVGKHLRQMAFFGEAQGQGGKSNSFSELGLLLCTLLFLYGDNPRGSMRCNGKNLRPKLLDDTSSQSREAGHLNSGLDSAAHSLRHIAPRLCLTFVNCQRGLGQPFLPNKVAVRIQGDGG